MGFVIGLIIGLVAGYALRHNLPKLAAKFPGVAKLVKGEEEKE